MDVNTFQIRATQFVKVWSSLEPDFVIYFKENYLNRVGKLFCNLIIVEGYFY